MSRILVTTILRAMTFLCFIGFFSSCYTNRVEITQININQDSLASTFTKAPDPRQKNPPRGQQLLIKWNLDQDVSIETCQVIINIIYKNFEQEQIALIPRSKQEEFSLFLLGERYDEKKGFLTYHIQIFSSDKQIAQYQHPLWFERKNF